FKAGEESQQTTVAKSALDYDYLNEEYELIYDPTKMSGKHEIAVEVYDQDRFTKNDIIGLVNIDVLPSLNRETQIDLFLQPQEDKKDDQIKSQELENSDQKLGKISLSMIYLSEQDQIKQREQEESNKQKSEEELNKIKEVQKRRKNEEIQRIADEEKRIAEEKRKQKERQDASYIKGVVKFKNISVRNLKKMDIFSKTDPFVVFKAGEESQQTTVAKSALDYDYLNEEYELIY
ncbi:MAG: hypothetical protein EZS28_053172, partial [Streblomastix strix]